MRKCLLFIVVFCLGFGCSNPEKEIIVIPKDTLPKDSISLIIADLHIIDAAMRHRDVRKMGIQSHIKKGFIDYFDTSRVTKARFVKSLEFWGQYTSEMESIYDHSMEILSARLASLEIPSKPEKVDTMVNGYPVNPIKERIKDKIKN